MIKLLNMAKYLLSFANIPQDGVLADFTMGNGHDTLHLCSLVPKGKVYAFDIQQAAVESTRKRLSEAEVHNAELILDSHANAGKYLPEKIHGGMFNLGYLPGGDKNLHTMRESSLKAVLDAMERLCPGGVLTISVYPGHEEGRKEGELLKDTLEKYDKTSYSIVKYGLINSPDAPYIIAVQANSKEK